MLIRKKQGPLDKRLSLLISLMLCMALILSGCEQAENGGTTENSQKIRETVEESESGETLEEEPPIETAADLEQTPREETESVSDNEADEVFDGEEGWESVSGNKVVKAGDKFKLNDDGQRVTEDGLIVVDLVFFMGQSNMSGTGGNADYAPKVPQGHGYEFRAISDPTRLYPIEEPFGKNENVVGAICDLPGTKNGSLVSAFANKYYDKTGIPIVAVSISEGATTTEQWLTPSFQADMKERVERAIVWLSCSGYYINNRYAVWLQGESDAANGVTSGEYTVNMDDIIRPLFIKGLNKVFIITPGRTISRKDYFNEIIDTQINMCRESGYYALATTLLSGVSTEFMVDEWHYNQKVLNLVGEESAKSAARYTNERKEAYMYDYKHNEMYYPVYGYCEGNEKVKELDLTDFYLD